MSFQLAQSIFPPTADARMEASTEPCYILDVPPEVRQTVYEWLMAGSDTSKPWPRQFTPIITFSRTSKFLWEESMEYMNTVRTYPALTHSTYGASGRLILGERVAIAPRKQNRIDDISSIDSIRRLSITILVDLDSIGETQELLYWFVGLLPTTKLTHLKLKFKFLKEWYRPNGLAKPGKSDEAWKRFCANTTGLIRSDAPVPPQNTLATCLRSLEKASLDLPDLAGPPWANPGSDISPICRKIVEAVLFGDYQAFKQNHAILTSEIDRRVEEHRITGLIEMCSEFEDDRTMHLRAGKRLQRAVDFVQQLQVALNDVNMDTSSLGCAVFDRMLREVAEERAEQTK